MRFVLALAFTVACSSRPLFIGREVVFDTPTEGAATRAQKVVAALLRSDPADRVVRRYPSLAGKIDDITIATEVRKFERQGTQVFIVIKLQCIRSCDDGHAAVEMLLNDARTSLAGSAGKP